MPPPLVGSRVLHIGFGGRIPGGIPPGKDEDITFKSDRTAIRKIETRAGKSAEDS